MPNGPTYNYFCSELTGNLNGHCIYATFHPTVLKVIISQRGENTLLFYNMLMCVAEDDEMKVMKNQYHTDTFLTISNISSSWIFFCDQYLLLENSWRQSPGDNLFYYCFHVIFNTLCKCEVVVLESHKFCYIDLIVLKNISGSYLVVELRFFHHLWLVTDSLLYFFMTFFIHYLN